MTNRMTVAETKSRADENDPNLTKEEVENKKGARLGMNIIAGISKPQQQSRQKRMNQDRLAHRSQWVFQSRLNGML
jgi:hypothetical protein